VVGKSAKGLGCWGEERSDWKYQVREVVIHFETSGQEGAEKCGY